MIYITTHKFEPCSMHTKPVSLVFKWSRVEGLVCAHRIGNIYLLRERGMVDAIEVEKGWNWEKRNGKGRILAFVDLVLWLN